MEFIRNFPLFCIIACLLSAVITSALRGGAARKVTLCLLALMTAMHACVLYHTISLGDAETFMMGHFPSPWGNEIRFGIVEPLLSGVFSFVMFLSVLGGKPNLVADIDSGKMNIYYTMLDLVQAAMISLAYTNDIFTGYVFIEICTLSSCGILMIRQVGRTTLAAIRYMIFSLLGSGLFLLGVILLYGVTGHLLMPGLRESVAALWATGEYRTSLTVIIGLITMGLSIKSGLFPFHFWMPDTYGYSTPTSSAILSGIISKGYIFFLIKLIFSVFGTDVYYASGAQNILFVLGVIAIIVGSISAIHENDINRMTAFSSAAQIGYVFMGIGLSPTSGILAALFHIVFHAITKPSLFLSAARLSAVSRGSKKFSDLQGAAHRDALAGVCFTVGAFSMVGIPMFAGFVSKYLFAVGALESGWKMLPTLIALAVSTILNTVYFLRTVVRICTPSAEDNGERASWKKYLSCTISGVVFIVINLAVGLYSKPLIELLENGIKLLG